MVSVKSEPYNDTAVRYTFYLNGEDAGSRIFVLNPAFPRVAFKYVGGGDVGSRSPRYRRYFNGSLDETLVFSRALEDSEIERLYNFCIKNIY